MIRFVTGDLFTAGVEAIAHGCNCQGVMGTGVARKVRNRFKDMYAWYRKECLLGRFELGDVLVWQDLRRKVTVFNLATQYRYGRGVQADLVAIERALRGMCRFARDAGIKQIGMPRIGAGHGGLPWEEVKKVMIKVSMDNPQVELVVIELEKPKQ